MTKKQRTITAIVDTREQRPLDLGKYGLAIVHKALPFGDYSLAVPDLSKYVVIERKSLPDFVQSCTHDRKRFERELLALRGYMLRFIVCEFKLSDILSKRYMTGADPDSLMGSIARFAVDGIPCLFAENHAGASYLVAKILGKVATATDWGVKLAWGDFEQLVEGDEVSQICEKCP